MGRQHIGIALFAAIWLVVLIVPTLRLMLLVQAQGDSVHRAITHEPPLRLPEWVNRTSPSLKELAQRHPNDVRVLAKAAEEAIDAKVRTQHYDRLIQRFPREVWLIANRLRYTAQWFNDDRAAGELDNLLSGYPPRQKNFTPDELKQAIAITKKGQQLEPDNSYFDWMLAYFLFTDYRDKEALAVLHEGAKKPRYDDHTLQDLQASIAVRELARPLLFEEKFAVSAALVLPHFAKHRHVARLAVWEGVKAERAGDHPRALQIYSDVARLGARMRESSRYLIHSLVAIAIEAIAWRGVERKLSKAEEKRLSALPHRHGAAERARVLSQRFARYAAAHGRADLAEEARRHGEAVARFREQVHFPVDIITGFPDRKFARVLALWWASAALLPELLLTAFVWGVMSVILRLSQVFGGSVRSLDVASSVLVGGCASALWMVMAVRLGAGWGRLLGSGNPPGEAIAAFGAFVAVTPALLGAAYCAAATMWRHRRTLQAAKMLSKKDTLQAGSLRYPSLPWWERDLAPLLHLIGTWALHLLTIAAWVNLVIAPLSDEQQNYTLPLILSALCVLRWVLKWLYFTPVSLRPITGYGLRWYRQTLGAFLLLSSAAYLILSLASLPLRHDADAKENDIIRRGELTVLLEQERQHKK